MKRSLIPLFAIGAIFLVLVGACVVILLQKDKSNKDTASENTVKHSGGAVKTEERDSPVNVNSLSRPEATRNSTHKEHHGRFCRTCCQTPPCWYNNHKECSRCADQSTTRLGVSRLLRKSFKTAARHHRREQLRMQENNLMH